MGVVVRGGGISPAYLVCCVPIGAMMETEPTPSKLRYAFSTPVACEERRKIAETTPRNLDRVILTAKVWYKQKHDVE